MPPQTMNTCTVPQTMNTCTVPQTMNTCTVPQTMNTCTVPQTPVGSPVKTRQQVKRDSGIAGFETSGEQSVAKRLRTRKCALPSPSKSPVKGSSKCVLPSPSNSPVKTARSPRKRLHFGNNQVQLPSPAKETRLDLQLNNTNLSAFSQAKALLQRSAMAMTDERGCLGARDEQFTAVASFLDTAVGERTSNSLYITGPPGTGKTAQVEALLNTRTASNTETETTTELYNTQTYTLPAEFGNAQHNVNIASVNCITLKDPAHIFHRIHQCICSSDSQDVEGSTRGSSGDSGIVRTMQDLQRFLEKHASHTQFIVVLDEMDKLVRNSVSDTHATRIIFELFLLARLPALNFILVGIANSLDLKDKFLSRLNLRQDLLPETVVFNPYSAEEMATIISNKMSEVNTQVFNPVSIRFAAKKCAGYTGDLRRLLDVLRHSIEIVELEQRLKKRSGENTNAPSIVGMQHIARVFQTITNAASTRSRIAKLNIQQRVLLCCLVQREKTDVFGSSCTLDEAFVYYAKRLNSSDVFKPLNRNEFIEVCNTLDTCGLVAVTVGRSTGRTKQIVKMIKTTVDDNEFTNEISKTDILKNLLQL